MKNLHLMPMNSFYDDSMVSFFNENFPLESNVFFHPVPRDALNNVENCYIVPEAFSADYINAHAEEYNFIVLHSLFLNRGEILSLTDAAAKKIIWIVWGHDLYDAKKKHKLTISAVVKESIHAVKKLIRGTYVREYKANKALRRKVGLFHCIGIGYPYDEKMIRKKYGKKPTVVYGPVIGEKIPVDRIDELRKAHLDRHDSCTNILIGHCGFQFLEHEKYLSKISCYKDENIHLFLVLSYGADQAYISKITNLVYSLYGKEKVTIVSSLMGKDEYLAFLSTIDVAIFPFLHQSALGNTKALAFMGTKLYFHPRGVLAKGFGEGGVKTYDCRKIGKISFTEFIRNRCIPSENAPLFFSRNPENNIAAWKQILE